MWEAGEGLAGKASRKLTAPHFLVFCEGKIRKKESLSSLLFGKCWERQMDGLGVVVFHCSAPQGNALRGFSQGLQ